jgi:hypothetical protein
MTNPTTPLHPASIAPMSPVSINDNLSTSSPSPKSTLIGLGCIVCLIAAFVLYVKMTGF